MSVSAVTPPRLIAASTEILELLADAARGTSVFLTRRELLGCEKIGVPELQEALQDLGRHKESCLSRETREMLGTEAPEDLAHASDWLEAGARLEELLSGLESHGPADYIFCLDPWAAQILNQSGQIVPDARWVLVSDVEARKSGKFREYWEQLEQWLGSLPFHAVIPRTAWDRAIVAVPRAPSTLKDDRIHLQKPGAWQWRSTSTTPKPSTNQRAVIFLVRYSGSLSHLRIFLDTVARQDYPKESLRPLILAELDDKGMRAYLKWLSRAHPSLQAMALDPRGWKPQLNRILEQQPDAVLVLIGDHSVLPHRFVRAALESLRTQAPPVLLGVPLDLDASAQILTGNLDPLHHYPDLLRAFSQSSGPQPAEIGRILPPEQWRDLRDPVSRIMASATPHVASTDAPPVLGVLQLADDECPPL
jgi:hypothetical protein